jgi:hypothetical protein
MSAWAEYQEAIRELDSARRAAAATAAEQATALRTARDELAAVRQRLALQQARLTDTARRHGVRLPDLARADSDGAVPVPGDGPAAVLESLHRARAGMDAADAELTAVDAPAGWPGRMASRPPAARNLVVYGAFTLVVLALQVVLFVVASEESLPALAPVCGLVLPLLAFALGWLAIGILFPTPPGSTVDRTPLVGAVVCIVAPVLLACASFGILAVLH